MMPSVSLNTRVSSRRCAEAGFTLTELVIVAGIMATVLATTVMVMPGALRSARADSGASQLVAVLRLAREQAIAQRRNVQVVFTAPNRVSVWRVEVPGPGTTLLSDTRLEGGGAYQKINGLPDTPDAFGGAAAVSFSGAATVSFASDGEFVNQVGDPVNGTVFLSTQNEPISARAVTVFGPTALIREWHWNGARWSN